MRDDEIEDVWEDVASGPEDKDVDIVREEIVIPDSQGDPEVNHEIISDRLQLKMRAAIQYLQEYSRGTNLFSLGWGKKGLYVYHTGACWVALMLTESCNS